MKNNMKFSNHNAAILSNSNLIRLAAFLSLIFSIFLVFPYIVRAENNTYIVREIGKDNINITVEEGKQIVLYPITDLSEFPAECVLTWCESIDDGKNWVPVPNGTKSHLVNSLPEFKELLKYSFISVQNQNGNCYKYSLLFQSNDNSVNRKNESGIIKVNVHNPIKKYVGRTLLPQTFAEPIVNGPLNGVTSGFEWKIDLNNKSIEIINSNAPDTTEDFTWAVELINTLIIKEKTTSIPNGFLDPFKNVSTIINNSIDIKVIDLDAFKNVGSNSTEFITIKTKVNNILYDNISAERYKNKFKIVFLDTILQLNKSNSGSDYPAKMKFTAAENLFELIPYSSQRASIISSEYTENTLPWRCIKNEIQIIRIHENVNNIPAYAFTKIPHLIEIDNMAIHQTVQTPMIDEIDHYYKDSFDNGKSVYVKHLINNENQIDFNDILNQLNTYGINNISLSDINTLPIKIGKHTIYDFMTKEDILNELITDNRIQVIIYMNINENQTFYNAIPQPDKGYIIKSKFIDSGKCGDNLRWTLDNNYILKFIGAGDMYDYESTASKESPWHKYAKNIKEIVLSEDLTHVGSYAFTDIKNVKKIHLTQKINSLGYGSFHNCSIETINFPESLSKIDGSIFLGCNKLKSITGATSYFHIVDGILYNRENTVLIQYMKHMLTNPETSKGYEENELFELPTTVTTIEDSAFYGVDSIQRIFMDHNARTIKSKAFSNMKNLYFVQNKAGKESTDPKQIIAKNAFENSGISYSDREIILYRTNTEFDVAAKTAGFKVKYYEDLDVDHINAYYDGPEVVVDKSIPLDKVTFEIIYKSGKIESSQGTDPRFTISGNGIITDIGKNVFTANFNNGYTDIITTSEFSVNGSNSIDDIVVKYTGLNVWYGEKVNPADILIHLLFSNGSSKIITAENKFVTLKNDEIKTLSKFEHTGTQTVTVIYNDKQNKVYSKEIELNCDDYIESITASYADNGSNLKIEATAGLAGLTEAIKNNVNVSIKWKSRPDSETYNGNDGRVNFSGGTSKVGEDLQFIVTYTYLNRFNKQSVVNIPCESNISDVTFQYAGVANTIHTPINLNNIIVTLHYKNGTVTELRGDMIPDLKISPESVATSGTNSITVTYNTAGFSKVGVIYVEGIPELPIKLVITQRPKKTIYEENEIFNPDGLKVNCIYDNGKVVDVSDKITVDKTPVSKTTKNVKISYKETHNGKDHVIDTFLAINANKNQKELTRKFKFDELYEIEKILFRSKKTEDSTLGVPGENPGEGKWKDIVISDNSATRDTMDSAMIKAGYGFELKVFTRYKTNRGNEEYRNFMTKENWDISYDNRYDAASGYIKEQWSYLNDIYPQYVPTSNPDMLYAKIIKRNADGDEEFTNINSKNFLIMEKTNKDEKNQVISEGPWYNSQKIFEFPLRKVNPDGTVVSTDDEQSGDRRIYVSREAADTNKKETEYVIQILSPAWYGYEPEPAFDELSGEFVKNDLNNPSEPGLKKNWHNGDPSKYLHVVYEFSLFVQKNDDIHTHILQ